MNKLTVVVFCYNHGKFIAQALDSILQQKTTFPFTVLVSDDASTDGSQDILKTYAERFPQTVKLLLREKNLGAIENYRQTLAQVRSEYVVINDGDDYFTCPEKLQLQTNFLDAHPDCSICFHPVTVTWDDSSRANSVFPEPAWQKKHTLPELLDVNFMQTNSVMYRWAFNDGSLLENLPEAMLPNDHFLHLLHAEKGDIGFLPEVMSAYRRHESSLWNGAASTYTWFRHCAEPHIRFYQALEHRWNVNRSEQIRWLETSLEQARTRRLALYVFWEKDGIVRDYVTYYLKGLQDVAQDITVIVNGKLSIESRKKLEELGVDILVRKNEGLDFAAWKEALLSKGWDEISKYDELILCNCSCYGPIYPFAETFQTMSARKCDFWGLTKHPRVDAFFVPGDPNTRIEEHIQSYFIVFRKKLLTSKHFRQWWENLVPAKGYKEEVGYHETKFSKYFEDAGYISSCLMNVEKYFALLPNDNSSFIYANKLLIEDRIPLIKRKLFIDSEYYWTNKCLGHTPGDVFKLIKNNTTYNEYIIWQDLLATQKFSSVKDALHLNYILPSHIAQKQDSNHDTALLCFAYYPDLCSTMCHYIASMPEHSHICIISSREDTLDMYRKAMQSLPFKNVEYRLKPNRGRDVSAYLVTGRDILQNHELVCCIHDKKSKQLPYQIMAEDFAYHGLECCLHNKQYVENIIDVFNREPFCGMLVPPTVYYGDFCTLGAESHNNEASMKEAYDLLSLSCPMDDTPVAPFGAYFWARCSALKAMFRHEWKYEDFPDEPLPVDSTISHGIERIYPIAVQDEGYYTAWCSPDAYASLYMNNLSYMMREYNKRLYKIYSLQNWKNMLFTLDRMIKEKRGSIKFKKFKYYKYKILSKITFGTRRKHYKEKYKLFSEMKKKRHPGA